MVTSTESGVSIHYHTIAVCKMTLELSDVIDALGWVVASEDVDGKTCNKCQCETQIFSVLHHRVDVNLLCVELLFDKRVDTTTTTSFYIVLMQASVTRNAESVLWVLFLQPCHCQDDDVGADGVSIHHDMLKGVGLGYACRIQPIDTRNIVKPSQGSQSFSVSRRHR